MNFNTDPGLWDIRKFVTATVLTVKNGAIYRDMKCNALFSSQEDAANTLENAGWKLRQEELDPVNKTTKAIYQNW